MFCFLAHVRQLVESFALLVRNAHWPTTFYVGRALVEVAGHARYVLKKLRAALQDDALDAAWTLLDSAQMGRDTRNRQVVTGSGKPWPQTIHVLNDVRALGDLLPGESRDAREREALELYAHFCEFCHPNMAAFVQYAHLEERGERAYMRLRWSPDEHPPVNEVSIAVIIALVTAAELLEIYRQHPEMVTRINAAREEFCEQRNVERERRDREETKS